MNRKPPNMGAKMTVMVGREFACVKLAGRANFAASVDFETLVHELRQRSIRHFVLDLTECALMDSTFLGGLAGFGLAMAKDQPEGSPGAVELLNPNPRIVGLLQDLGILELFKCCQGTLAPPAEAQTSTYEAPEHTRLEMTRASLEAHRLLMGLNPENAAKFKDVAQFLAEDLKRLESGGPSA